MYGFLKRGTDLYNSLVGIIWKFREKSIVFSADIRDMFHQVVVRKENRSAQRFMWKKDGEKEPSVYEMQVIIFGAVSSPYSAQYIKNVNALDFKDSYPQAVEAIVSRHYMDDYLDSVNTEKEAIKQINDVIIIHKKGGFELRGWICNAKSVFENIPEDLRGEEKTLENKQCSQRILGLKWIPFDDSSTFTLNFHKVDTNVLSGQKMTTKREMLKVVMSLYDPLGLLGNYFVGTKILLQEVWRSGISWDNQVTSLQYSKWKVWLEKLKSVHYLKIQRCYSFSKSMNYSYMYSAVQANKHLLR